MDDAGPLKLRFDAFELDEANARLSRAGQAIPLPPKSFAVLCELARRPGTLLTKDALLDAVWGHRHVSESVLKSTISQLRIALEDDARQPRYIETAARRGYRFIGIGHAATPPTETALSSASAGMTETQGLIGRRNALDKLRAAWQRAQAGQRQLVWIAGEAGVGKTMLIESFLAELDPASWVRGYCVEQFGAGEPYLPVLEGATDLCRRDPTLVRMLRDMAPTWLARMPWLCTEAERNALQRELAGANQERMVREARELFDTYSLDHPLLFVTEDLHWTDDATLRLMDHFIRRKSPARLMWLGSLRLAEVVAADDHPLKSLRHELRLHRLAEEIALDSFSEAEVGDYLAERFPALKLDEDFVRGLHGHTDGLPLFLVNVLDDLVAQGVLDAQGATRPDAAALAALQVPESLAGVIGKQAARLPEDTHALLEAASVCGMEFRPRVVAALTGRDAAWVAARCEELARRQQWLDVLAVEPLPDGTLEGRYVFRHALYRRVLYQGIGALTCAQLHRAVAEAMERDRAQGLSATAAELASHRELGRDWLGAARHYADAAEDALRTFAPTEAMAHVACGLALLERCPEDAARHGIELTLQLRRGVVFSQRLGMGAAETRQAHERAEALCDLLPASPALGWALAGLGQARYAEGDFAAMRPLGARVHEIAQRFDDQGLEMSACTINGMADASQGLHRSGQQWLARGIAIAQALGARLPTSRYPVDPWALMQGSLAIHLVPTGHVDQARRHADNALARGRSLGHPMAICFPLRCYGLVEARLRRVDRVAEIAEEMLDIAHAHDVIQAIGSGRCLAGWVRAHAGDPEQGYAEIRAGCELLEDINMTGGMVHLRSLAVDALLAGAQWDQAQAELDAGFALMERIGERFILPDLLLLRGRIAQGRGDTAAARTAMQQALDEARAQDALWYELSALVALCELKGATQEETVQDKAALKTARARLTEGRDTVLVERVERLVA